MPVEPNNPSEQVLVVSPPAQKEASQPAQGPAASPPPQRPEPGFYEPRETSGAASTTAEKEPTLPIPAVAAPPPAAAVPSTPSHSPVVSRLAAQYGLTPDQIAGAGRDELENWVDTQRQRELAYFTQDYRQQAPEQAQAAEWEPTEEAGYEKPLVELVRGLKEKAKRADALEQRLMALEHREGARHRSSVADSIDAGFDALGAAQQYGSEPAASLVATSAEMKRRLAVLSVAGVDLNNPPPARVLAKKIKEAHEAIYGAAPPPAPVAGGPVEPAPAAKQAPAKDPVTGQFLSKEEQARQAEFDELWKKSALAAPTHRNGAADGTGYEAAVRGAKEYLENRAGPESGRHKLADEFPK